MSIRSLNSKPRLERDPISLLSPIGYDDDAASLHSRSDQDTDSDDDELQIRARNSRELRAADSLVLLQEEELEELVTDTRTKQERGRRGSGLPIPNPLKLFGRRPSQTRGFPSNDSSDSLVSEKRKRRRVRRKEKKDRLLSEAVHGEDGQLMYEMEEGGVKEGSSTGDSSDREGSDEVDRRALNMMADAKVKRSRNFRRGLCIYTMIAALFAVLSLLAWKLSGPQARNAATAQQLVSNGTALFGPTTIIISLDGFRADFLQRGITPRLSAFIKEGVSPKYMLPAFPSVTFPNHYTLATGLHPESHGIVGNTFWDPELQEEFYYSDPARSFDSKWWKGEPFWVTAEKQGVRTAVHMWPGSEADIGDTKPSFLDMFNGEEPLSNKVARVLEFLDKPGLENKTVDIKDMRPQLIAAYVPNVDGDGHKYGPNSTEIRATIKSADDLLDQIFQGLEERNLTGIVNVIVVSDHGMATTDVSRVIQLEDLVDMDKVSHTDGWPLIGLRPKNPDDLQELYKGLVEKAGTNPNIDIYLRDVNMPARYHFSHNPRIAPLWIVPKTGWALVKKGEMIVEEAKAKGEIYHPRGLHGYDYEHPLMRAIFVARGPAFPHPPNSQISVFQNIEVYNILCDSVGMTPKPNNGTLRLPLNPIGLHNPDEKLEEPADPVPSNPVPTRPASPSPVSLAEGTPTSEPSPAAPVGVSPVESPAPDKDLSEEEEDKIIEEAESKIKGFWDWLSDEFHDVWDKITGSGSDSSPESGSR